MATVKKTSSKKEIIDDVIIMNHFMIDVLENNEEPKNIS